MGVTNRLMAAVAAVALSTLACVYIVLPEGLGDPASSGPGDGAGWIGMATSIAESPGGGLHIDVTIRNDTGVWSTMRAADGKPAVLNAGDGTATDCETVILGTGGHRLAPGFQIRGYTRDEDGEPASQPLYVECPGASVVPGSTLKINYFYFLGDVDYYLEIEEENRKEGTMEVSLDEVVTNLTYPVGTAVEGLIQPVDLEVGALSDNVVKLLDVQRNETGIQFTWQNYNPYKFALKTHIGIPPVVGADGIIYGVYQTLDIPPVPLTPAKETAEWTTDVAVPPDVNGLYILLSVESKKPRTYANYAIDITDK